MAYARMDIYWPDGRIESYLLEAPTVTIGRAADNTIVLDTETVSRHHFSITHTNNSTYLNDLESENGVVIDGAPLKSYEAHMLEGVEELQVGFLRIIYQAMDESATVPIRSTTEGQDTQRMNANGDFSVQLDVNEVGVWPASSSSAEIAITNHLKQVRRFFINISGMPTEWIRVNRPEVEISPLDTTYVLINIKPPRKADIKPASYTITVEIVPKDRSEGVLRTTLPVTLHGFGGFGTGLSKKAVEQGESLTVFLHNQGSEELTMALSGRSPDNSVQFRFSMPRITLTAGSRSQVKLEPLPLKQSWFGQPSTHKFFIVAQAQNPSRFLAAQEASVTFKPRLPMAALIGGIVGGLALLAMLLLVLVQVMGSAGTLVLNDFTVSSSSVVPGDVLTLRWDGSNAQVYRVSVNQILVTEVAGDQRTATISTEGYTSNLTIALVAENGEQTASLQQVVALTIPLSIEQFTVSPDQLIGNVVTPLTITWDAPGAEDVTITGLENFTKAPIPANLARQGELNAITGYAAEPVNVLLTARDSQGNVVSQVVTLDVIDATCTTLRAVTLSDGPGTQFQQVSSVATDTPVVVVAQDQSSGWLRVGLPGNLSVWGPRDAFRCADNFNLNDLRVEVTLATATPVVTPSTAVPVDVPTATLTPVASTAAPSPTPR